MSGLYVILELTSVLLHEPNIGLVHENIQFAHILRQGILLQVPPVLVTLENPKYLENLERRIWHEMTLDP
jgi:hypothetical protein